jgi:hypothetical protein
MYDEPISQGPQASDLRYRLLQHSDEKSTEEEGEFQLGRQQTYVGCVLFRPWTVMVILLMVLITNLILLSTSALNTVASHSSTYNHESTIHTSFSQDRAFQSLDHAYDNMWEALSLNKTSAGLIHDADIGVNAGIGAIAM